MTVRLKRAYEPASPNDGRRYLVDRLWPRGVTKRSLQLSAWLKEVAPSEELRRSYCHDPALFPAFRRRYLRELEGLAPQLRALQEEAQRGTVTLVFGARDAGTSNAAVLAEFLESGRVRPPRRAARTPRPAPHPVARRPRTRLRRPGRRA